MPHTQIKKNQLELIDILRTTKIEKRRRQPRNYVRETRQRTRLRNGTAFLQPWLSRSLYLSSLTVEYENSGLLKLALEALYIHKIGTGNRNRW